MSKKIYANAAEKQRAWRIRTGKQKEKVSLALRRGERLGSSESEIREKKEGESWEEYSEYLKKAVTLSRQREKRAGGMQRQKDKKGASATFAKAEEKTMPEDYYERREEVGKPPKGRKVKKGSRKEFKY